jgi:2-iminobutanoate/2-iminopropanoate deaminase
MRKTFDSQKALSGTAPLSTLTEYRGLVFLSGVTAIDPVTGTLEGDSARQAEKAMGIIRDILEDYHLNMDDVLRVTIYLKDMKDFQSVNAVYSNILRAPYPARTCVEVAALPLGALVEMDVIAGRE